MRADTGGRWQMSRATVVRGRSPRGGPGDLEKKARATFIALCSRWHMRQLKADKHYLHTSRRKGEHNKDPPPPGPSPSKDGEQREWRQVGGGGGTCSFDRK